MKDHKIIYEPRAGTPGRIHPRTHSHYEPSENLKNLFYEMSRLRIAELVIKHNFNIGCEPGDEDWHYGILYIDNDFKSYLCQEHQEKDGTVSLVKYEIDRSDMLTRTIGMVRPMKEYGEDED